MGFVGKTSIKWRPPLPNLGCRLGCSLSPLLIAFRGQGAKGRADLAFYLAILVFFGISKIHDLCSKSIKQTFLDCYPTFERLGIRVSISSAPL